MDRMRVAVSLLRRSGFLSLAIAVLAPTFIPAQGQIRLPWRSSTWEDSFVSFRPSLYRLGVNTSYDPAAGDILLTPSAPAQSGRLYLHRPLFFDFADITFTAYLGIRTSAVRGGADGIVFALSRLVDYVPTGGGSLDFDGCLGYGIEFDTYENGERNDPWEEHIAVISQNTSTHLRAERMLPGELKSGTKHDIRISFALGAVRVFLDGTERLTYTIPAYAPFLGYAGFTASTGASFNEHRIDDIVVSQPTRTASDLGLYSACDTVRWNGIAVVMNNHPSGLPLSLVRLQMTELDGTGEFVVPADPFPALLALGDSIVFPLRFTGTGERLRRAVVRIEASNGEAIEDTLAIELALPRVAWGAGRIDFPTTPLGRFSDRSVVLRNTGRIPAVISASCSPSVFSIISPTVFPRTIVPGDSLAFTIRFLPVSAGLFSGILSVMTCAGTTEIPLTGEGRASALEVRFLPPPLMLNPGGVGTISAVLSTDPGTAALTGLDAVLRYDPSVARFRYATCDSTGWPGGTRLTALETSPGTVSIEIRSPAGTVPEGNLFHMVFACARQDTGCTAVLWDTLVWNPLTTPGDPQARGVSGRICVNPSCRIPEGLMRRQARKLSAYPNPSRSGMTITVALPEERFARLEIRDQLGTIVHVPFQGVMKSGSFPVFTGDDGISSGVFFLVLSTGDETEVLPLVILR
ncbi:MAG: hypothetical protein QHI48_00935 [Bacteroidota bacterium]|nr:hypothetical protein [Bacteroidota bacterium]